MKKTLLTALVLAVFCSCSCSAPLRTAVAPVATTPVAVAKKEAPPPIPHIKLAGVIDESVAEQAVAAFDAIEKLQAPAVLFEINSPGGSVNAGFLISKAIEESSATVVCVVDGTAASMAFYILQSCDLRVMTHRSVLMAHEPAARSILGGKADDWKKAGKEVGELLETLTKAMNRHIAQRLLISLEEFSARIHNTEYWMDMEEALKIGAVDVVVVSVAQVQRDLAQ